MTVSVKNKSTKIWITAVAVAVLIAAAYLVPKALGFSYVHTDEDSNNASGGVITIVTTLDETQVGGGVTTGDVLIPANENSVQTVLSEGTKTSENRSTTESHHDYSYESYADYLEGSEYEIAVYAADAQDVGTTASYTSDAVGDESYADLQSYDSVYITVTG